MDTGTAPQRVYELEKDYTDYTISTLTGLSIGIVTFLFGLGLAAIKIAAFDFSHLMQGRLYLRGDPTLLYMTIFLISATMLLLVQHHFNDYEEDEEDDEDSLR